MLAEPVGRRQARIPVPRSLARDIKFYMALPGSAPIATLRNQGIYRGGFPVYLLGLSLSLVVTVGCGLQRELNAHISLPVCYLPA
jgi:hypothetical protein